MKITIIATKLNFYGGGENHDIIMKVRTLRDKGYDVSVVTIFSRANNVPSDTLFNIFEEQAPSSRLIALQIFIIQILKKYASQTDIFYLVGNSFFFGGGWYRLLVRSSKPVVADINGYANFVEAYYKKEPLYPLAYIPYEQSLLRKVKHWVRVKLERSIGVFLINRLDAIVILTRTIAQHYMRAGVKADIISVIPSFYDIQYLQEQPLRDNPFLKYGKNIFNILFTGRLHIDKGVDILIKAFSKCNCPKAIIHIVGEGPEKEALEKLVKEKRLDERVIFYSWREPDKLIAFYQHADLFVHTARLPEPLVRTTVEAMAFGLPIVSTDTCGEEWFDKELAKTFPLGDTNLCARAIEEAYNDKSFREKAKYDSIRRAKEFDYRKQIINLESILKRIYD